MERQYDQFRRPWNYAQTNTSELETYYSQIKRSTTCSLTPTPACPPPSRAFSLACSRSPPIRPTCRPARPWCRQPRPWSNPHGPAGSDQPGLGAGHGERQDSVAPVTPYSAQIAELNQRIVIAQGSSGQPPTICSGPARQPGGRTQQAGVSRLDQQRRQLQRLRRDGPAAGGRYPGDDHDGPGLAGGSDQDRHRPPTAGSSQELPESLITGATRRHLLTFRSGAGPGSHPAGPRRRFLLALTFNDQHARGRICWAT